MRQLIARFKKGNAGTRRRRAAAVNAMGEWLPQVASRELKRHGWPQKMETEALLENLVTGSKETVGQIVQAYFRRVKPDRGPADAQHLSTLSLALRDAQEISRKLGLCTGLAADGFDVPRVKTPKRPDFPPRIERGLGIADGIAGTFRTLL